LLLIKKNTVDNFQLHFISMKLARYL